MSRGLQITTLLSMVAAAAQLAGGVARAATGPRDPSPPQYYGTHVPETREERRERKAREMNSWLRRLVGRYRMTDGMNTGQADCTAIGDGAGVHCVMAWHWPRFQMDRQDADRRRAIAKGENPPDFPEFSTVVIYQFGYDAITSRIHFMKVGPDGLAEERTGTLSGDRMTSTDRCINVPAIACLSLIYVDAPHDALYMTMGEYIVNNPLKPPPTRLLRLPDDPAGHAEFGGLSSELLDEDGESGIRGSPFGTGRPR